ncbi:MAG: response regulator [Chloroflexota bacterium]|nr:MAG: response regulator [Chloroflexota bacterium]
MTSNNSNAEAVYRPSILIVEDSPPQALKVKLVLESNGCQVVWADTGWAGVAAAKNQRFDLIVLDVELPDIDGFTVCRNLKAEPELAEVPVVMLTTRDHAEDVLNGLEIGAVDYIPKDAFAEIVLLETIKQMVRDVPKT